nr:MAG TPA: hypothetical protein [Microviridae sp.]
MDGVHTFTFIENNADVFAEFSHLKELIVFRMSADRSIRVANGVAKLTNGYLFIDSGERRGKRLSLFVVDRNENHDSNLIQHNSSNVEFTQAQNPTYAKEGRPVGA